MPKVKGSCEQCGAGIEFYPSQRRRFCSQSCMGKFNAVSGMPLKPRTGRDAPCEQCGRTMWVRKHAEGRKRFCSKACFDEWQRRNSTDFACELCGRTVTLSPSQSVFRAGRFCSKECEGQARTKRPLDREHNGKPAVVDHMGYVRVYEPGHHAATRSGWVFEHRLLVEQALGRTLARNEHVHHLNHVRHDNRPENLVLMSHSEHSTITGRENGEALRAALTARQQLAEYERRFGPLT